MKLIIAEKPSVARSIAETLGATNRQDGYFEGNGYTVTFAFGHLFSLFNAADYDPKYSTWSLTTLPIIPASFRYKINDDAGYKKQFSIMKRFAGDSTVTEIINACDSDREGSLIFGEIYQQLGSTKPIKRLWVSSHTPEDLKAGFDRIRTGAQDAPLTAAGYSRQWADWLLGINFTIAATKKISADGKMLNVGRVILPTVYLVYKRELEIKNFTPKKYFILSATFAASQGTYTGVFFQDQDKTRHETPKVLEGVAKEIKGQRGVIVSCKTTKETEGPGKLFNLTDLQGHITSRYTGWTADKVLKAAQGLYEAKFITYPRTSSRYLDDSQKEPSKKSLEAIKRLPADVLPPSVALAWHDRKSVFDSSKVDSHPALIPTYIVPNLPSLSPDERTVYIEIVKRFAAQFAPLAEYEKTEAVTQVKAHKFRTRARVLVAPGWTLIYQNGTLSDEDKKQEEDELTPLAFQLKDGMGVLVQDVKTQAKETKPPQRYTIKTLLAAMQNCGKEVEDETQILKGYAIGTAATRAEILKKIEKTGYVTLKGKSFYITGLGSGLCEAFPVREMLEPDFTGRLEKQLKDIELGTVKQQQFLDTVKSFTISGIERIKGSTDQVHQDVKVIGKCPDCGRDVIETPKAFSCSGYREKEKPCKFALWKDDKWFASLGKKITLTIAKGLLAGKVVTVKNMESKAGKVFDSKVKMIKESDRWKYSFEKD